MQYKILVYGLTGGWGGVESIVLNIMTHIHQKCNFTILISDDLCLYESRYSSSSIRFLHMSSWGQNPLAFRKELKQILQDDEYDYVWINGCLMSNRSIISLTKKHSNAKIITHSHGTSFEEDSIIKSLILKSLHYINRGYYLKNVDYYCSCSLLSAEWFYGKKNISHIPLHIVNNGIDVERFAFDENVRRQYRNNLGVDSKLVLLHAGRLTAVKNQTYILEILQVLISKGSDAVLLIAGEGELEKELIKYANKLGVEKNVHFLGYRSDVAQLCQAADYFVLPSLHEGLPVTVVEAQASGLKCMLSSNITREADISGLVYFLPITVPASKWADVILTDTKRISRNQASSNIKKNGYDISDISNNFLKHIGAYGK